MYWLLWMGIATGMRTMTPIAVFCWFAYLGLLPQEGWTSWSAKLVTVIVFTVLAIGEYFGDLRPEAPNRTATGPLAAHASQPPTAGGVIFGAIGALIGAFAGIRLRLWAARKVGRDWPVGLTESAVALGIAIWGAYKFHRYWVLLHTMDEGRLHWISRIHAGLS
jgi:uncharacterized membrane protein